MENKNLNHLLIVSLTPYFLEKGFVWFGENLQEILIATKTQTFFQDNTLFLEKGQSKNLSETLRKLDEMGYERVFKVSDPGEFSQIGGIVEVFPINLSCAVRLDFLGNKIDNIELLENLKIKDEEKSKKLLTKKLKSQKLFSDLKDLKPGDYLVHLDHGIGKFVGVETITHTPSLRGASEASNEAIPTVEIASLPRQGGAHRNDDSYYVLEYAQNDKLFVPLGLERKLSQYVSFADPLISRLGSSLWQKTKRKIKEEVEKFAKELLALYAEKEIIKRQPYFIDQEMENQLASGFLYEETPDQIQAILDIKKDLQNERPMDRIVCGDVGFGKTEVAMRTALVAVSNSGQVALLCPTTILANQHFNNFKKRFEKFPIKIALLSRLQSKVQQAKIAQELKEGKVDVIIGTHRILSGDIEFKNLQLLIIDDEQKFGVKQKEKLRKIKTSLDVLSLSATPIPRTLYLSLSSFKDVSLMQTPPQGRTAIKTQVLPYSKKIIKQAINFELKRKGQVYFLHNRVESIEKIKTGLEKLVPKAKISFIHGKMPEQKLVKIMDDFQNNKINILVATTIIENGIDLPNVNTIIIEDATRLGLSQAYQIRGRVGRSNIQSFAYLFFAPQHLTEIANPVRKLNKQNTYSTQGANLIKKHASKSSFNGLSNGAKERLKALEEATELGAGYRIALKDLELRGAGNILGKEQSGSINKIGLNLYCQMLSEAVEKLKN